MTHKNAAVAMFIEHARIEKAILRLQEAGIGIDPRRMSVVGKGYQTDQNVIGYYAAGERMKYWGQNDAFWGGILNVLFGSGFFAIPGIGPVIAAGAVVSWIVGALEGAAVTCECSAFGAGLYSIGIPQRSILRYEYSLNGGEYMLIVHGTPGEVTRAEAVLNTSEAAETQIYMTDAHDPAIAS